MSANKLMLAQEKVYELRAKVTSYDGGDRPMSPPAAMIRELWQAEDDLEKIARAQPRASTLAKIATEVQCAREKFPGNRFLLAALTEEVGGLAQALLQRQGAERIAREAMQVACVAIRILEEGDASFDDITDEEAKP